MELQTVTNNEQVQDPSLLANGTGSKTRTEARKERYHGKSDPYALSLGRIQAWNDMRMGLPLLVFDGLAVLFAIAITTTVTSWVGCESIVRNWLHVPVLVGLVWMVQHVHGLYPACGVFYSIEFRRVLRTCFLVIGGIAVGLSLRTELTDMPLLGFVVFAISLTLLLVGIRPLARRWLSRYDWWVQPVAVVGNSESAIAMHHRLSFARHEGLRSIGIIFDPTEYWGPSSDGDNEANSNIYLGPLSDLRSILINARASRVAIADTQDPKVEDFSPYHGIPHIIMRTGFGKQPTEKSTLMERDGEIEMHCSQKLTSPTSLAAKRAMDLILVIGTMPFWIPLMIAIGVAMKWSDPGPLFFKQRRVGRFGKPFNAIKFRSMVCDAEKKLQSYLQLHPEMQEEWAKSHKLKQDPRVTRVGEFLRKTSLDELPQLWNVLRGEMSLVGPRPVIDCGNYDRKYIEEHPEVFELYQYVRPGITGLWQISGRNNTVYEKRVHFDRLYLHNWSVMLDVFILWRTIKTALFREGAF